MPSSIAVEQLGFDAAATGLVIVDHGSRRAESNDLLLAVVEAYRQHSQWRIVEPAHMELAEPSIRTAVTRCVEQGARLVVAFPYFLGPGRHWSEDIPRLVAEATAPFATDGVRHLVTAPLGLHPLLLQVIDERIEHCLRRAAASPDPATFATTEAAASCCRR